MTRIGAAPLVVKVGGSLFDLVDLPERLLRWIDLQAPPAVAWITGGGEPADWVRRVDERWGLAAETAHDWALDAMRWHSRLLELLLRRRRAGADWATALRCDDPAFDRRTSYADGTAPAWTIVDVGAVLTAAEAEAGERLVERSWEVTSDSLAAWTTACLNRRGRERAVSESEVRGEAPPSHAWELTLLKSAGPVAASTDGRFALPRLVAAGLVDPSFARHAAGLSRFHIVDLRRDDFPTWTIEATA